MSRLIDTGSSMPVGDRRGIPPFESVRSMRWLRRRGGGDHRAAAARAALHTTPAPCCVLAFQQAVRASAVPFLCLFFSESCASKKVLAVVTSTKLEGPL